MAATHTTTTARAAHEGAEKIIPKLNHALNRELTTAIRYLLQGSSIQGVENEPLRQLYRSEFQDELRHAQYLSDKINYLGGTPKPRPEFKESTHDVAEMLEHDISEEEVDIAFYREMAKIAEQAGDIELKLQMEETAADESRHCDALRRLLGEDDRRRR
jgi:bacterioferritin